MAGLNVNDVVGVQIHGELFSQRTISTFMFRVLAPSTTGNYVTAIQNVADQFDNTATSPATQWLAAAPQNWTWTFTRAQKISPVRAVYGEAVVGLPGLWPADATTVNLQASITRRSNLGTRRNVGALHTPGLPVDAQVAGELSGAYKTALAALGAKLLVVYMPPGETTELQHILWSPATAGDSTRSITSVIVQDRVGTMHRRTVRLGI